MDTAFDPYHHWLAIPPQERPADYYRLLGVPRFEAHVDVISNAADARMAFIRTFQAGPKGTYSQQILNELATARATLLNPQRKAAYDQELSARQAAAQPAPKLVPVARVLPQAPPQHVMNDLARQLESVKSRESMLAAQQAQYAAALAQAEATRHEQSQRDAAIREREAQLQAVHREVVLERQRVQQRDEEIRREKEQLAQELAARQRQLQDDLERAKAELVRATGAATEALARQKAEQDAARQQTEALHQAQLERERVLRQREQELAAVDAELKLEKQRTATQAQELEGRKQALVAQSEKARAAALEAAAATQQAMVRQQAESAAARDEAAKLRRDQEQREQALRRRAAELQNVEADLKSERDRLSAVTASSPLPLAAPLASPPAIPKPSARPSNAISPWVLVAAIGGPVLLVLMIVVSYAATRGGKPSASLPSKPQPSIVEPVVEPSEEPQEPAKEPEPNGKTETPMVATPPSDNPKPPIKPAVEPMVTTPTVTPMSDPPANTPPKSAGTWRWARFRGPAESMVLTPDEKFAVLFNAEHPSLWGFTLTQVSDGRHLAAIAGDGKLESNKAVAAGVAGAESHPLVAFSYLHIDPVMVVQSLMGDPAQTRQFGAKPPDARYAFSADGKFFASSDGKKSNAVKFNSTEHGNGLSQVIPGDMPSAFVEQMFDCEGELLVHYSNPRASSTSPENRVVLYDWKTHKRIRSRDFAGPASGVRGVRFVRDDLWVWGGGPEGPFIHQYSGMNEKTVHASHPSTPDRAVADVHIPSQSSLHFSPTEKTVYLYSGFQDSDPRRKRFAMLNYAAPALAARFVEQGQGVLCLPGTLQEPLLLWNTANALDAFQNNAPSTAGLGLDTPQSIAAQRVASYVAGAPTIKSPEPARPMEIVETPERKAAREALAPVTNGLRPGPVQHLALNAKFMDKHAELLSAFPELQHLSLEQIEPTTRMFELFAQLPKLENIYCQEVPVTDAHLATLAKSRSLNSLSTGKANLTGMAFKELNEVPLKSLYLESRLSPEGWEAIAKLPHLEALSGTGQFVDDQALAALSQAKGLKALSLRSAKVSATSLKYLEPLVELRSLEMPQIEVPGADLPDLRGLTQLTTLRMPHGVSDRFVDLLPDSPMGVIYGVSRQFKDAGLIALAKKYPSVQILELAYCNNFTEQGFAALPALTQLKSIVLPTKVDAAMCRHLAKVSSLSSINAIAPIPAAALAELAGHPQLQHVTLQGVDDDGVTQVSKWSALARLQLNQTTCTSKGLEHLVDLRRLEDLTISGKSQEYGEAEIAALAKLTHIKSLSLYGVKLDEPLAARLKESLPGVRVAVRP
jgi:hypothetical protein